MALKICWTPAVMSSWLAAFSIRAFTCTSAVQIVFWWMPLRRVAAAERNTARRYLSGARIALERGSSN
jgi:hypothetical protein